MTTRTIPPYHDLADGLTFVAWVCVDCYQAHHYGPDDVDHDGLKQDGRTPDDLLSRLVGDDEPALVTAGLRVADHGDDCPNVDHDNNEWLGTYDCYCERQDFSWSQCDGCGSSLGGSREALTVTVWKG